MSMAPQSLGAVKRSVDAGSAAGRYILTGSARAPVTTSGWPATGRIVPLAMFGLTRAEIEGKVSGPHAAERLFASPNPRADSPQCELGLIDYVEAALQGGFPDAIERGERARLAWCDGYVDQLIHRDIVELEPALRGTNAMARLLRALALNTAGTPTLISLGRAADIDQRTTARYLELLHDIGVVDRVPAWSSSRLKRLVKLPKYYLTDPAMAVNLAGDDLQGVLANGEREVDLVLESAAGKVVGIEIKAAVAVTPRDARHLAWLRDQLGPAFMRGVVLHCGPHTYPLGERLWAMPIGALWRVP